MIQKVFVVFDSKMKSHLLPFFLPQEGMAERTFKDFVNDENHQFGKHPEDYTLICLGEFDEAKAQFNFLDIPKVLGTGIKFKEEMN